jgi:hypothetical protein
MKIDYMKIKYIIVFILLAPALGSADCFGQFSGMDLSTELRGNIITLFSLSPDSVQNVKIDSVNLSNQQIRLVHLEEKWTRDAYTDAQGNYIFYNLKPGGYNLIINDPLLTNVYSIHVNVSFSSKGRARLKPIIIDRINQSVSVKKT